MSRQINLLNRDFYQKKLPFSAATLSYGLFFLFLAATLCYAFVYSQVSELEKQLIILEKRLDTEHARLTEASKENNQTSSIALETEINHLEAQIRTKQTIANIIRKDVQMDSHHFSDYMRAFARQLISGLWLTGFVISNTQMTLTGRTIQAELLPAYLQQLGRETVMQGIYFSTLQIKKPDETESKSLEPIDYLEFNLSSSLPEK